MSRSSRPASKRSRRSRTPGESELSVTEASFQSLNLTTPSTRTEHLSVLPAYQTPGHSYRRTSFQEDLSSTYLQPSYDTTGFPIASPSPSGSFIDPSADFGNPSDFQLNPDPAIYDSRQVHHTTEMSNSYGYAPSPVLRSQTEHRSYDPTIQSMQDSGYSFNSTGGQRRSMSGSHGPKVSSGLASSRPSTEEREMARQRRRGFQESRRQSKIHARRTRLPSTISAREGGTLVVGSSVDVVAAPSQTPYIGAPLESSSSYGGQPLAPSAPRDYMGGISGSSGHYDVNVYPPAYGMSTVNTQTSYAPSQPSGLRAPSDASLHPYSSGRSHSSGHSVSPKPENPVRIVGSREKPQCWEHGCNGREFSTFSNLLRHQREKSGTATKSYCPRCGAEFTRTTARNGHMAHEKCKPRRGSGE